MKLALGFALMLAALASDRAAARNPLDSLRLETLSATRERPLFRPSRRPPPPLRVEAPRAPAPVEKVVVFGPPPFDLIGAVIGRRTALVLLRNRTSGKIERLRQGQESEGWTVDAIGLRSVTLTRDGRTQALALTAPQAIADAGTGTEVAVGAPQAGDAPGLKSILGHMRRHP